MNSGCIDVRLAKDLKADQSPAERAAVDKMLSKAVASFENNPVLKKFGYNDIDTMQWLWQDKVGVSFDLEAYNFRPMDVKKFEVGIKEYSKQLTNPDGLISQYMKIPRRLLDKIPEARKHIQQIELAQSYYRDNTNEPSKHLNNILENFTLLAKGFGITEGQQRSLETKYRKAATQYNQYKGQKGKAAQVKARQALKAKEDVWSEIMKNLSQVSSTTDLTQRTPSGELYLGLRDVLEGVIRPQDLTRADGKTPWKKNEIELMQKIHDDWAGIRLTGVNAAIQGVNQLKMMIKANSRGLNQGNKQVLRLIEKYDTIIRDLEFQKGIDGRDITAEAFDITGKFIADGAEGAAKPTFQRKYMPHYVLDVMEHLLDINSMMMSNKHSNKDILDSFSDRVNEITGKDGIINRIKSRAPIEKLRYSVDPFYFMNKYIHDIAKFNLNSTLNRSYVETARALQKRVVESGNATEVTQLIESVGKTMNHVHDVLLHKDALSDSGLENLTRFVTALEHTAKMGGNIRSGIRNRLQKVFEYIHFGGKAMRMADDFYTGAFNKEHRDLVTAAKKHHGIGWEARKSAQVESVTHGAVEKLDPTLPGEFKIVNGKMIDATPTVGQKVAEGASNVASSTLMSGLHRRVETKNREGTFDLAFALSYMTYKNGGVDFIKREMIREGTKKDGDTIKDKTAWDWAAKKAGNMAYRSVLDLHFDYSRSGKPKLLQTKGGRVFGQYQNYRFGMIDLQSRWLKDAKRALEAGDYTGAELQRIYRAAALYTLVGGAGVVFNANFGNLIANDTHQMATQWWDFMTADEETDEGKRAMSKAFYGVGPVVGTIGGPVGSDIMTLGEIYDLWSLDEYGLPSKASAYENAWKDKDNDKLYNTLRLLNGQAARTYKYTMPQIVKGDIWQAMKIETGLYPSKAIREWRELFKKKLGLTKVKAKKPKNAQDDLLALSQQLGKSQFKNTLLGE